MKILFMCVANSARSQLAEGLARQLWPQFDIRSAGSHPGNLNPYAVAAMKEKKIDISNHYSKSVDELPNDFVSNLNFVITLCAEEVCPIMVTTAKKLHWPFPDPASREKLSDAEMLKRFQTARDAIQKRLLQFKQELGL
jgi:arsenate reductase (thioredoxin)